MLRRAWGAVGCMLLLGAMDIGTAEAQSARNWSGCYIGANLGVGFNDTEVTTAPGEGFSILPLATPAAFAAATRRYDFSDTSIAGGGQVGCRRQDAGSPWVLGLEADINATGFGDSKSVSYAANVPWLASDDVITSRVDWYGTVRGRLGYAIDDVMVFATAGLAFGGVEASYESQQLPAFLGPHFGGEDDRVQFGWTVGGGIEWALADRWSLRAEYLHVDLGDLDYRAYRPAPDPPTFWWDNKVDTAFDVVRLGVSYQINGPLADEQRRAP